jgi:hypothetical protein
MTHREFEKWSKKQFERIEQKNESDEYKIAVLMAHMVNINKGKKRKASKPEDFIKKKKKKENQQMSINMMYQVLKAVTLANGGTVSE